MPSFYDSDGEIVDVEPETVNRNIRSNMHHLIFCDLTVGRSDDGLEPFTSHQVNNFIDNNRIAIECAVKAMYSGYESDDDLHTLMSEENPLDWFGEYLYRFVDTGKGLRKEYDDDDEEEYPYYYDVQRVNNNTRNPLSIKN